MENTGIFHFLTQRCKIILVLMVLLLIGVAVLDHPQIMSQGVSNGLILCANVLIPALFPFLVLTAFLQKSSLGEFICKPISPLFSFLFKTPACMTAAIFMSFIGGYPVGAMALSDLYRQQKISARSAKRGLMFCVNAGPSFILSAVGAAILHSKKLGVILLVSCTLSSLTLGFVSRFFSKKETGEAPACVRPTKLSVAENFVDATASGCASILTICSFVVIFSSLIHLLNCLGFSDRIASFLPFHDPANAKILIASFLEISTGCAAAAYAAAPPVCLLAFAISFGGLSTHFQVLSIANELTISPILFFASRLAGGGLSALYGALLLRFFPVSRQTITNHVKPLPAIQATPTGMMLFFVLLVMAILFLFAVTKNSGGSSKEKVVK